MRSRRISKWVLAPPGGYSKVWGTILPPEEKTLSKVASYRRVEERRDTDIKSTATFGKLSALPLGEEFVLERSTKSLLKKELFFFEEQRESSIYAK
ncbi:hypothetical protein AVEN_229052-1 [Araneus ventricosus]|uniref:Uncharacterized protein n=1 Tax=Araneus ventricosus TaxID=182803 RepID=A0A4Y2CY39_ARAVE|nr:hypothetical protein AVEN_229052-1 [Araneus ventricosus]